MIVAAKKILVFAWVLSLAACSTGNIQESNSANGTTNHGYSSKRAIEKDWNAIKRQIFDTYNLTANEDDKVICSLEKVKKKKRKRLCMTKRHRYERSQAAKAEICTATGTDNQFVSSRAGCETGSDSGGMSNTLVADRAAAQMMRINEEIIELAKTNPELETLLKKSLQLQKIYESM